MTKRKRRLLPGEGDYGTNFDQATRPEIGGGRLPRVINFLAGYENELTQMVEDYQKNLETGYLGIRETVSLYQIMTQLRGFWPMSSVGHTGDVFDLSGQGRTLGASSVTYSMDGIGGYVPIAQFNGTSSLLSRVDDDGINLNSMANGFTLLGWVRPGWTAADTTPKPVLSKGSAAGTLEYALVVIGNTMLPRFFIGDKVYNGSFPLVHGEWHFLAAAYDGSNDQVTLQVNADREIATIATPALVATADDFFVGRWTDAGGNLQYFDGDMTLLALCAGVVPELVIENLYRATAYMFGG